MRSSDAALLDGGARKGVGEAGTGRAVREPGGRGEGPDAADHRRFPGASGGENVRVPPGAAPCGVTPGWSAPTSDEVTAVRGGLATHGAVRPDRPMVLAHPPRTGSGGSSTTPARLAPGPAPKDRSVRGGALTTGRRIGMERRGRALLDHGPDARNCPRASEGAVHGRGRGGRGRPVHPGHRYRRHGRLLRHRHRRDRRVGGAQGPTRARTCSPPGGRSPGA